MKEFTPIRLVLEKHSTLEMKEEMGSMEREFWDLVILLNKNESSFLKLAQNMVVMLNKVLTLRDQTEIGRQLDLSKFESSNVLNCLEKLHDLAQKPACWMIIAEVQSSFTAHCIKEAAGWISSAQEKNLFLKYNKENNTEYAAKVKTAQKLQSLSEEKYQQVSDFCSKYRVLKN